MTAKNALLFFLAVFGIIFIGAEALFPVIGLAGFSGALYAVGGLMLALFLALVLGFGFLLKVAYLIGSIAVVTFASEAFVGGDFVMGIVFAVVAAVLLALIPAVFLRKK